MAAPSATEVDQLEALLPSNDCIGRLDHWERHYFFESVPAVPGNASARKLNEEKVGFVFMQAGFEEFKNRRVIHSTALDVVSIDDRAYQTAGGSYDIRSGRIDVKYCGPNI